MPLNKSSISGLIFMCFVCRCRVNSEFFTGASEGKRQTMKVKKKEGKFDSSSLDGFHVKHKARRYVDSVSVRHGINNDNELETDDNSTRKISAHLRA